MIKRNGVTAFSDAISTKRVANAAAVTGRNGVEKVGVWQPIMTAKLGDEKSGQHLMSQ
jgi:hypothetical protein